jgi:hypothetical protein
MLPPPQRPTMCESIGVSRADGLSVSIHLESAPDAPSPDRLAVTVLIPLDILGTLTPSSLTDPPSLATAEAPLREIPAAPPVTG